MRKHTTRRLAAPALEWLRDVSGHTMRVTAIGCNRLLVENHRGVRCFTQERIFLATRCGEMCVAGERLSLNELRRDALVIRGSIHAVYLPASEAANDES